MIKTNLVPLSFNDVERCDYASALYDSTVKALGFDEVRVRYRELRRSIVRNIILNQLSGQMITEYISKQSLDLVKQEERELFVEDIMEDIKEMDISRIAGLGITPDQLTAWLNLQK